MKKLIVSGIAGTLLIFGIKATGQLTNTGVQLSGGFTYASKPDSKKSNYTKLPRVTPAVMRNFLYSYGASRNEKWFELHNGFVAIFHVDSTDYQVAYAKKGTWIRTIRSYTENELSRDVRHIVKTNYYDYGINSVQEIARPKQPTIYLIQLLGKTELINLQVCEGEMTVLQTFKKSE